MRLRRTAVLLLPMLLLASPSSQAQVGPAPTTSKGVTSPFKDLQAMASAMAGYPQPGDDVEIGLKNDFPVPASFNSRQGAGTTVFVSGKLKSFDTVWVGLESAETGSKLWVPRESVKYVMSVKKDDKKD